MGIEVELLRAIALEFEFKAYFLVKSSVEKMAVIVRERKMPELGLEQVI